MVTCAKCDRPTVGKSKYCRDHREIAREEWKKKIADSAAERGDRELRHRELFDSMRAAAQAAWDTAVPQPMTVTDVVTGVSWHVPDGVCGFSNVVIRPANSSFALWIKKNVRTYPNYYGGLSIPSHSFVTENGSQSYDRKVAATRAAVEVLRAAGVKATADSRLD